MISINLEEIRIEIPENPTRIWDGDERHIFHDFRSFAYYQNINIGYLNISICMKSPVNEMDDFWFNKRKKISTPRPVIVFQRTLTEYRGLGISGRMIILANEISKIRFNQPLASDTTFCENSCWQWREKGYHQYPAQSVWEKLEEKELAYSKPYKKHPRWIMR